MGAGQEVGALGSYLTHEAGGTFLDATNRLALIVPTRSLVERNGMHASGELRFDRYRRKTCDFTLAAITGDVAAYLDLADAKHLHSAQAFSEQRL